METNPLETHLRLGTRIAELELGQAKEFIFFS